MLWKALLKHWQNKGQSLFVQILDAKPNWTSKKTYPNTLLLRSLTIIFFLIIKNFNMTHSYAALISYIYIIFIFLFSSSVFFTSSICVWKKKGIKYNPLCTRGDSGRNFRDRYFYFGPDQKISKIPKFSWLFSENFRTFSRFFPPGSSFFYSGQDVPTRSHLYCILYFIAYFDTCIFNFYLSLDDHILMIVPIFPYPAYSRSFPLIFPRKLSFNFFHLKSEISNLKLG